MNDQIDLEKVDDQTRERLEAVVAEGRVKREAAKLIADGLELEQKAHEKYRKAQTLLTGKTERKKRGRPKKADTVEDVSDVRDRPRPTVIAAGNAQ